MTDKPVIKRRKDWEEQFVAFIHKSQADSIFCDWVHYNCASWVSDAIVLMSTDAVDLYAEFRGKSKSPATACRMIKESGFKHLGEIVASKLESKPNAFATRGDVILTPAIPTPIALGDEDIKVLGGSAWDGPRSGADPQFWSFLGMPYAVCLADPPFAWNITEHGIDRLPITSDCLTYDVGALVCPQH